MKSMPPATSISAPRQLSLRPRGFQFGLLTLLCVVTLLGCILGRWFYYRPLTAIAGARLFVVDRAVASAILAKHELHPVEDSTYGWLILNADELTDLLQSNGIPANPLMTAAARHVPFWPQTAFTGTYAHSDFVHLSPTVTLPVHEMGAIGGFLGSRVAGIERQFRVECNVSLHHPNYKALSEDNRSEKIDLKGKLFYEGALPDGHLVFLAPLGEDEYSAIDFDVK
jgi:hypothetical protein